MLPHKHLLHLLASSSSAAVAMPLGRNMPLPAVKRQRPHFPKHKQSKTQTKQMQGSKDAKRAMRKLIKTSDSESENDELQIDTPPLSPRPAEQVQLIFTPPPSPTAATIQRLPSEPPRLPAWLQPDSPPEVDIPPEQAAPLVPPLPVSNPNQLQYEQQKDIPDLPNITYKKTKQLGLSSYHAIETHGQFGLIDLGKVDQCGNQLLTLHIPHRSNFNLHFLQPGETIYANNCIDPSLRGKLSVSYITPDKYVRPGNRQSTCTIAVPEHEWELIMSADHVLYIPS